MASERNVQFSAPTWLRDLGFSSWLLVGFVLIIVGLIWLLAETSTIVMPVILAAVLGAVAGPGGRLAGAPPGSAYRRRDPRPARARRHRRAHLLPRLRRHLRQLGRHLGEAQPGAGQDPGLAERPRRRQHAERQGGRAEGRARDPHDAAERGRGGHRRPQVAGVLPRLRDAQHAVRAQGRAGHAPLHQPAHGRARTGRQRRHDQHRQVAAQLLPRRDDHRRVQRRPDRGRGADPRRAARGDDRGRHVRGGLRARSSARGSPAASPC